MTLLSKKLTEKEIELLVVFASGAYSFSRKDFPFFAEKISESVIKEDEIEGLLKVLIKNGYIKNSSFYVMISEKGKKEITDFIFNNWKDTKTRWRRLFSKSSWIADIAKSEVKLVRMLLQNEFIEINDELLNELQIDKPEFAVICKGKLVDVTFHNEEKYLTRGSWFVKKCAEIVHNAKFQQHYSVVEEWTGAIIEFFDSIEERGGENAKRKVDIKFQRELFKIKDIEVCPIGLPKKCISSFLHDEDSIFQTERHFLDNANKCKIVIKPSYCSGDVEDLIFVEMIQSNLSTDRSGVLLQGKKSAIFHLLLKIKKEMEKILNENENIDFRKSDPSFDHKIEPMSQDRIAVVISSCSSTRKEKIVSLSHKDINTLLRGCK